jgi:hypothetical protein
MEYLERIYLTPIPFAAIFNLLTHLMSGNLELKPFSATLFGSRSAVLTPRAPCESWVNMFISTI